MLNCSKNEQTSQTFVGNDDEYVLFGPLKTTPKFDENRKFVIFFLYKQSFSLQKKKKKNVKSRDMAKIRPQSKLNYNQYTCLFVCIRQTTKSRSYSHWESHGTSESAQNSTSIRVLNRILLTASRQITQYFVHVKKLKMSVTFDRR